jgi:hypothetical protein
MDNSTKEFKVDGNIIGANFRRGHEKPKLFVTEPGLSRAEITYLERYVQPIRH